MKGPARPVISTVSNTGRKWEGRELPFNRKQPRAEPGTGGGEREHRETVWGQNAKGLCTFPKKKNRFLGESSSLEWISLSKLISLLQVKDANM